MAPAPTILGIKQKFLERQTRLLSQPVAPSRAWRRANANARGHQAQEGEEGGSGGLPDRAIDDALYRLDHALRQHARRAWAPQATRHVAEQLDRLYWNAGEGAEEEEAGDMAIMGEGGLGLDGQVLLRDRGTNFTKPAVIAALPPAWESERDIETYPPEARRYAELAARLQELNSMRAETVARVQRLRRMRELLAPFGSPSLAEGGGVGGGSGEGGTGGVQENLVTRGGEVERELERMRVLLARVGDGVARLPDQPPGGDEADEADAMAVEDIEVYQERKLDALLQLF